MADGKYREDPNAFDAIGIDLNRPVDSLKPGKWSWLKNVRSYQAGTLQPREGTTLIDDVTSGQTPAHSLRRLNDPANSTWTLIAGAGTHLGFGQATFSDIDSGYSGNPLALVPWKPKDSPKPFMYIGDSSRMRKIAVSGAVDNIGYAPPTVAPGVTLTTVPAYKTLDTFQATTGWSASGTAAAPSTTSRISTTIAQILFDVSSTGWATISPTATAGIGQGGRVIINAAGGTAETVTVQSVSAPSSATTIASIIYDSGTSGLCSIIFATPVTQAVPDGLLRNTTISENVRILSVTTGPQGQTSVRVSTSGTFAATNAIQVLASFRAYCVSTHSTTETLTELALRSAVTNGTGFLTKTAALDLSVIATGLPAQPSDIMHITLRVSDPTLLSEIKAEMDVDSASNDFSKNFYYAAYRASDLTSNAANLQSLIDAKNLIIQKQLADATKLLAPQFRTGSTATFDETTGTIKVKGAGRLVPIITSYQFDPGAAQFVELSVPIGSLIRVGSDGSRTLQNVAAIRLVIQATGSINFDVDSWWIGGGYGPDTSPPESTPYFYRYRARNPATNVPSNFSPPSRYEAFPRRQSVTVTPTQYAAPSGTSLSTSDFVIDIERFGGTIPEWHYVGTVANGSSPTFADIYPDDTVSGNPTHGNTNYQPWPILGLPVTGTTGTVAGTTLNDSGSNFNTSWAMGIRILVNNQPYTIYKVISTSRLETFENMGSQTGVVWRIDEPTILAQTLPCLWEWDGSLWACGDPVNAGRLYRSNPNSETTTPNNYLEVTSPSEPLMNGLQFNVRGFVFSTANMAQILPTGNPDNPYRYELIPDGRGMFSRWGLTREPAPIMAFLAKDGIYATQGGTPISLTDADLYPLFPNEGNLGTTITLRPGVIIEAPEITLANAAKLRLSYSADFLYFDYPPIDDSTTRRTLLMAFDAGAYSRGEAPGGWFWDVFTPSVVFHYGEEGPGVMRLLMGATNGSFYQYAGDDDAGAVLTFGLLSAARDQGDPRSRKLYGDVMLDSFTDGVDITATPLVNNHQTALTSTIYSTTSRQQTFLPTDTPWTSARNVSILIGGNLGGTLTITAACPTSPIILNVPYSVTLTASGGVPPYTWTLTAGSLPTGLTLNSVTGEISGTPTVSDDFSWTITVTDSEAHTATISCSLTVEPTDLFILACPPDDPIRGVAFEYQMEVTGGSEPYSWALTDGAFPDGISIDTDGLISGTAVESGTFNWTVTVTDDIGGTGSIDCVFEIAFDVTIRPTTYSVVTGSRGGLTNPERALDNDDTTFCTFTINGGTGLSSFTMLFLQDFLPAVDLTGLDHVQFYMRMESIIGNPANTFGPTLYGEVFDGIDTSDTHHPPGNGLATCFAAYYGDSGPTTYASDTPLSAIQYAAVSDLTFRTFVKQQFLDFSVPWPDMNIYETWAVLSFS